MTVISNMQVNPIAIIQDMLTDSRFDDAEKFLTIRGFQFYIESPYCLSLKRDIVKDPVKVSRFEAIKDFFDEVDCFCRAGIDLEHWKKLCPLFNEVVQNTINSPSECLGARQWEIPKRREAWHARDEVIRELVFKGVIGPHDSEDWFTGR